MANLKYIGKNIFNHDLEVKKGNVSGSATSTGSFGRGEVTTLEASSFGSSASTLISGSITSVSSSISTRLTTEEGNVDTLQARDLIAGAGLTGGGTLASDRTFNVVGGTGITANANDIQVDFSDSTLQTTISGSLGTNATLIRSLTAAGISGSVTSVSSSLASRITTAESELGNTLISSSAQIASDISGSFTSTSSSLASRITTEEGNVDTLQARDLIAGTGLTGGGTLTSDRTFNVVGGTGITANANDIEIDFSDSTLQTTISGSVTSVSSSLAGRITTAESELGNTLISSSVQIASDISGSWRGALSGSLNIISGSSTSTGSFGNLRIAGNSAFGDLSFDTFPYNSNSNSGQFITLKAQDTSDKAILELASANVSSGNVVGEIHFINRSGDAAFNPIANITSHFSQGLLFKTQYGNNGEKVGIRITEENNAPPEVIIPSGSLEVKGNVSGSSTSTGSFGRLESDTFNTTTFNSTEVTSTNLTVTGTITGSSLDVSGNIRAVGDVIAQRYIVSSSVTHLTQSFSSGSTIFGDTTDDTHQFTGSLKIHSGSIDINSSSSPNYAILGKSSTGKEYFKIRNSNSESFPIGRLQLSYSDSNTSMISAGSNQLRYIGGENTSAGSHIFLAGNNTTEIAKFRGSDGLTVSLGNISGSSTSTGSFGRVETSTSNVSGDATISGNLLITGSSAVPKLTFDRAGQGSADIFLNSAGSGLIVDSGVPIQLDYTTFLSIEKSGTEFWRFTANGGLAFGDSSSTTSVLTIKSDSNSPISFEKSSNRQNYLEFKKTSGNLTQPWLIGVGTDATGTEFRFKNGSATPLTIASGSGNTILSGSLNVAATETKFQSATANQYTRVTINSGTSQYQAKLHLGGRLGANADYLIGEVAGIWDVNQSTSPVAAMRFESGNDHVNKDDGRITFWTSEASRTLTERMRIDYNGRVGIGTTSPGVALEVIGSVSGSSTSTGSFGAIGIGTAPSDYKLNVEGTVRISGLSFFHNVNNPQYIWNSGNLTFRHGSPGSSNVILKLRSTRLESALEHHFDDKIVVSGDITGSGNLEIAGNISGSSTSTGSFGHVFANGTIHGKRGSSGATVHPSADEAIFENSANAGISILSGNSNEAAVYFGDSDDNDVGRVRYDHSDDTMDLITGAAVRATVAATKTTFTQTQGIELINTGNNTVFHIPSSAGYTFGTLTNNHMSMWTNNTERVRILNSGNVGIGTTSPGAKLEVIGDISGSATTTGSFGAGYIDNKLGIGTTSPAYHIDILNPSDSAVIRLQRTSYTAGLIEAGSVSMNVQTTNNFPIRFITNGTERLRITTDNKISGSSSSTGSFGAVSIGKATADNQRALTIVGNVQLNNNNYIYFKRSNGNADPHIAYDSSNNFKIFNPVSGEIQLMVGSAEIAAIDGGGLTFNGSKTIGSSAGAGVITILGNSGLKLKSGGGGGSGPIELIQGSTTYWSVGASGALTGSADLVMNAGKNISGSATSTGSFGQVTLAGTYGIRIQGLTIGSNSANQVGTSKLEINSGANGNSSMNLNFHTSNQTYRFVNNISSGVGGENYAFYLRNASTSKNPFIVVPSAADNLLTLANSTISGSSTSTGSFGAIETPGVITSDGRVNITDGSMGTNTQGSKLLIDAGSHLYPIRFTRNGSSGHIVQIVQEAEASSNGIILTSPGNHNIGMRIAWSGATNVGHIVIKRTSSSYGILSRFELAVRHNSVRNDVLHIGHHRQTSTTFDHTKMSMELLSGSLHVVNGNISGSSTSTGSFGRVEATSISASLYQGQIGSRYVHSQTSDSATWVINHNIGHKYPVVTVYDSSDEMILPETGTATDSDTFTLTFSEAIQGKAVVSVGGIGENAGANYIHTQAASSTNWRVTHSLSQQYPNVTVYDDTNQVIIPESITAASSNEMDITFSSGKTGYANFSIGSGIPNISAENAGKVLKVRSGGQGVEWSPTSNDVSGSMSVSGSITPTIDNFHDLGSASYRWANLYTGDIQLSNEGSEGNEVDGTTGSWTIQEGEDDLYLLNRKNGKKYKFKLEEIT